MDCNPESTDCGHDFTDVEVIDGCAVCNRCSERVKVYVLRSGKTTKIAPDILDILKEIDQLVEQIQTEEPTKQPWKRGYKPRYYR